MMQPASPPPISPLRRIARAHPPTLRRLGWGALAAVIAIKLMIPAPALDCRAASTQAAAGVAVEVCHREYLRDDDPETGARLADAQRRTGNHVVARAIANGLLVSSAQAEARWVLDAIAIAEQRGAAANRAITRSRSHVELCTISP